MADNLRPRKGDIPAMVRTREREAAANETLTGLLKAGRLRGAAVILRFADRAEVFGHTMKPWTLTKILTEATIRLMQHGEQAMRPVREAHQEPDSVGETVGITTPTQAITSAPDGTLIPPPGETIISCGACHHPRFYATVNEADGHIGRLSCAHCGAEIVLHRIHHEAGRA